MTIVEAPKFTVENGTWNITLKIDGQSDILTGMPSYISAQRNYEILKKYFERNR